MPLGAWIYVLKKKKACFIALTLFFFFLDPTALGIVSKNTKVLPGDFALKHFIYSTDFFDYDSLEVSGGGKYLTFSGNLFMSPH